MANDLSLTFSLFVFLYIYMMEEKKPNKKKKKKGTRNEIIEKRKSTKQKHADSRSTQFSSFNFLDEARNSR